jgi:hypothetical protein
MKKLLVAVFGEENAEKPVNKAIAYAVIATAAALVLTVLILIISSIVFASSGEDAPTLPSTGDGNTSAGTGGTISTATVEYADISAENLAKKIDATESIKDKRSKLNEDGTKIYYAAYGGDTLCRTARADLDKMLVAFYKQNSGAIVPTHTEKDCNVPYVLQKDGKFSINIVPFNDESGTIENKDTYKWIYDNAYKYGFVYDGNTFTYVGVAASTYIKNNNISRAEFITRLKNATSNLTVNAGTVGYEIYYISASATKMQAPTNYSYTVIADGTDGYIITVDTSAKVNG